MSETPSLVIRISHGTEIPYSPHTTNTARVELKLHDDDREIAAAAQANFR